MSADFSQVTKVLQPLASSCVDPNPHNRPTSFDILKYLHECVHRNMAMKEALEAMETELATERERVARLVGVLEEHRREAAESHTVAPCVDCSSG